MPKKFKFSPSKNPVRRTARPDLDEGADTEPSGPPDASGSPPDPDKPPRDTAPPDSSLTPGHILCLAVGVIILLFSLGQNTVRDWTGMPRPESAAAQPSPPDRGTSRGRARTEEKTDLAAIIQWPRDWVGHLCFWGGTAVIVWSALLWFFGGNFWCPLVSGCLGAGAIALQLTWAPLLLALLKNTRRRTTRRRRPRTI